MPSVSFLPRVAAALLLAAGCNSVEGGGANTARFACQDLCDLQAEGEGCDFSPGACRRACLDEAIALSERCLLAAQVYYRCAAEVAWACPVAPDRPETEDARCAAEEHAWLVCRVTGDPPP